MGVALLLFQDILCAACSGKNWIFVAVGYSELCPMENSVLIIVLTAILHKSFT